MTLMELLGVDAVRDVLDQVAEERRSLTSKYGERNAEAIEGLVLGLIFAVGFVSVVLLAVSGRCR